MATYTVTTTGDVVDAGDGVLSLREALALADADAATADTIDFAPEVQGGRIVLAGSQLTVNSDVAVDGGAGVTIDANQQSRVLLVQGRTEEQPTDVALANLTVTGGHTTAAYDGGGGIGTYGSTTLTLDHVTVSGNSTAGQVAGGGGIFALVLAMTNCTVSGNGTAGAGARGGGIRVLGDGTLTDSAVSGNRTTGEHARGGGIYGADLTLARSTVSGNSTAGEYASGGGIAGGAPRFDVSGIALAACTVAGNSTAGDRAQGGGIYGQDFVTASNSTVSGNSTTGDHALGGGIFSAYYVAVSNSTVSGNATAGPDAAGGGIYFGGLHPGRAVIANSIVAGNAATGSADPDVASGRVSSNGHNIFGSDVAGDAPGDRQNVPAGLLFAGGLADNGGPTPTLALRDAVDNPALAGAGLADAPTTDQRGAARPQPAGGLPDVGAVEVDQTFSTGVPLAGRAVGFSGHEYLASYPDLEAAFGRDAGAAAAHYLANSRFEGRTILFDGLEYVASWPDLAAAFGADDDAGAWHYLEYGRAEGRAVTFDGLRYIASYNDLIAAFGVNRDAGSAHFVDHGAGEGRAPGDFDAEQYLANYADLRDAFGDDREAATSHFITNGYAEGRTDEQPSPAAADFLL